MKAFEGPLILGSPVLDCGKYPEAPGVCNDHTQFYKYNGPARVGAGRRLLPAPRRMGGPRLASAGSITAPAVSVSGR